MGNGGSLFENNLLEKINLLLTVGIYPPEIGGPATYVYSFANWLNNKENFEIAVATASYHDIIDSVFYVHKVKKKKKLLWHINFFFMVLSKIKHFDTIYFNGLYIESFLASILRGKKYCVRIPGDQIWERWFYKDGNDLNIDEFQHLKGSLKIRLLRKIRKTYLNKAEKVIAPSKYLAKLIEGWGIDKDKIEVVYNPYLDVKSEKIDLDILKKKTFKIVTGGRLVKWKGVEEVIKACVMLNDINLIIVGDGPERASLTRFVKTLNMESRVVFTGIISRGQLKTVFEESDCFVLNSQYEGLPHIVLESMHSNCPVAVSRAGGNIEVVNHKETGLLFNVNSVNEIEESIKIFQENKSLTKEIIRNAKTRIGKKFNRDIQFEKTVKIISDF